MPSLRHGELLSACFLLYSGSIERNLMSLKPAWTGLVSVSQWALLSFSLTQESQGKAGLEKSQHEKAEESEPRTPTPIICTSRRGRECLLKVAPTEGLPLSHQ